MSLQDQLAPVLQERLADCRRLVSADRLSGGASQETYRIVIETSEGERLLAMRRAAGGVFRDELEAQSPAIVRPGLAGEAALMQAARAAGVPAPEVYYVLNRDDDLGDGFIMSWLEGEALGTRIVRNDAYAELRPKLAYECGRTLARIHAIDIEKHGLTDYLPKMTTEQYVGQTWDRYRSWDCPQPILDYAGKWLLDNLPSDYTPALVHNDFRNGNFMIDTTGIIGVLDWELAHLGDPMRDLGWICTNAWRFGADLPVGGFGDYADLFRGYEEVSGLKVNPDRVKYWEVFGCFWWSVTCLHMADQYRKGPDRSVERAAIGRRASEGQVDVANLLMPGPRGVAVQKQEERNLEMPSTDELLSAVEDFLRQEVMSDTKGRTQFLSRVSANAVGIAVRQLQLGESHRQSELTALQSVLSEPDETNLTALRWQLVDSIREGGQSLNSESLKSYLRQTAINQIEIDNPRYSGLRQALAD